jgi:transcriptional regulator with XRE-family HTH domain
VLAVTIAVSLVRAPMNQRTPPSVEKEVRAAQARAIIGDRMRELREASGTTLRGAAQLSGWDKGHLSRVERGLTKPGADLVAWYDARFGAHQALERQFAELEDSVRSDRRLTRRDERRRAGREAAGPVPAVGLAEGGSVPADFDPDDRSVLVSETVPDGTIVDPGSVFTKAWTVHNAGTADWHDRWLTRQGDPGVPGWLASPRQVPVPDTAAGALVTVSVELTSPRLAGSFTAYFKMTDSDGRPYFPARGIPVHCTVCVLA